MSEAWRSYPGAPEPGADLCALGDIPDPGTSSVAIGEVSILVVRRGAWVAAYMNACPHQYLPLDYRASDVLSGDGSKIICSNHDAIFDVETGEGLGGHGRGCQLDAVPVKVRGGRVSVVR